MEINEIFSMDSIVTILGVIALWFGLYWNIHKRDKGIRDKENAETKWRTELDYTLRGILKAVDDLTNKFDGLYECNKENTKKITQLEMTVKNHSEQLEKMWKILDNNRGPKQ
jgi:peptidoglycan hydrolase CwlO-like protein